MSNSLRSASPRPACRSLVLAARQEAEALYVEVQTLTGSLLAGSSCDCCVDSLNKNVCVSARQKRLNGQAVSDVQCIMGNTREL